jgi:hypothetical protein
LASNDFGSFEKLQRRQTVAIWYAVAVAVLFFALLAQAKDEGIANSYLWQLASGFFFGNVLGFYVVVAKHRLNMFYRPEGLLDYFNYLVNIAFSLAAVLVAVWLLSGNGHEAAVIGAVAAVVVFIPATFESWIEAKNERDCLAVMKALHQQQRNAKRIGRAQ